MYKPIKIGVGRLERDIRKEFYKNISTEIKKNVIKPGKNTVTVQVTQDITIDFIIKKTEMFYENKEALITYAIVNHESKQYQFFFSDYDKGNFTYKDYRFPNNEKMKKYLKKYFEAWGVTELSL